MKKIYWLSGIAATGILLAVIIVSCGGGDGGGGTTPVVDLTRANALQTVDAGKQTFRFDTFGDEAFWGDTLKLHQTIEGSKFGGVGAGVSPQLALDVGLKIDVDALPPELVTKLKNKSLDLTDPANTLALIKLNAVIGITGFPLDGSTDGRMKSIGIQCAFCHSTVDDSLAPGIGHRLDGWANRDLNVGAIVNLSPDLSAVVALLKPAIPTIDETAVRAVLTGWGPGKFDAQLFLDGKAAGGPGSSSATLIPPAFGLAGVNLHTSTGWGSVTYWNAFVAVLEMHGKGTFFDPRLNDKVKFPVAAAAANHSYDVRNDPDLVTSKLPALQFYQLAIQAPPAVPGSFEAAAAARGKTWFNGIAKCATCHVPPLFTEPGWNMHTPAEIGIDSFQADRSPDGRYRTTPLKGLWTHTKGGFYHDGRFATLLDVVNHYNNNLPGGPLGLSDAQKTDLVEYMKSL